jgi:hypothetical protein
VASLCLSAGASASLHTSPFVGCYDALSGAPGFPPTHIIPLPLIVPLLFGWLLRRVALHPGLSPPLVTPPPGALASHHATASCLLLSSLSLPLCLPCRRKRGRRQGRGLLHLLIVKCPPLMAKDCCATTSSSLDVDNNAQSNVIVDSKDACRKVVRVIMLKQRRLT